MSKAKKYSIPKRVDEWHRKNNSKWTVWTWFSMRNAMIRLMREAYKQGQQEGYQSGYAAGLMAGRRGK